MALLFSFSSFGVNFILLKKLVSEDTVKDCVSRLFMVRMKLGDFDPPEMNPYKKLEC